MLGIQQMRKAEALVAERRRLARLYDQALRDFPLVQRLVIPSHVNPAFYKYVVMLPPGRSRNAVKITMAERFEVMLPGEIYSHPCHSQPVFVRYPDTQVERPDQRFPVTNNVCARHLCLPLYPGLTDAELDWVVQSLKKVLDG